MQEHLRLPADATGSPLARHARRRLIVEVGLTYAASWLTGVGYGFALMRTGGWAGTEWERGMLRWFHDRPLTYLLDRVMLATPLVGTNLTILPAMILVALWLWRRRDNAQAAVHLLTVSVGSLSLNPTMKHLLDRDRPNLFPLRGMFNWASYPSGHAILTTALYFTIALMLRRERGWRWPFVAALFIVLITCYSRLYLSVHWPTDLIGGLLIGVVWLAGTWWAFARYRRAALGRETIAG